MRSFAKSALGLEPTKPAAQPNLFDWPTAFDAENFLRARVASFCQRNAFARDLSQRMAQDTGTDFFEWIDHLTFPMSDEIRLGKLGFIQDRAVTLGGELVLSHPRAIFPRVILTKNKRDPALISLRSESVADFVAAHSLRQPIEGDPCSRLRHAVVSEENGTRLEVVERNSYRGFVPASLPPVQIKNILLAQEIWHTRCRLGAEAFTLGYKLQTDVIRLVGRDLACDLFFREERRYWEIRNRAARIQKTRQNRLGLGWGNQDHYAYRSSREHFGSLLQFLLRLGFQKRERLHAGDEGTYGAQICEHPNTGIVVACEVDLLPHEAELDFSTLALKAAPELGTVGLWVALHGESFLEAGLSHLAARFEFDLMRAQMEAQGISSMQPFSNFAFLRQTLTHGERWPVRRDRVEKLFKEKLITREQMEISLTEGAVGSHLEILERHGGYKGFKGGSLSATLPGGPHSP